MTGRSGRAIQFVAETTGALAESRRYQRLRGTEKGVVKSGAWGALGQ